MRTLGRVSSIGVLCAGFLVAAVAQADLLTADRAVQIALEKSPAVLQAEAGVLDAKGGLYGAYSGVLPRVSAGLTRSGSWTDHSVGNQAFGGFVTPSQNTYDVKSYSTNPELSASWNVLNLSSLTSLSAARGGLKAATLQRQAARNDVALDVRRTFYDVVQAVQIARVNTEALKLSRDDERRVRALFEVGSVSKSDLLKAQVRTAQSELDSLTARQSVVNRRVQLAMVLGIAEAQMGEIDTVLTATVQEFDEAALLAEAGKARPDLMAAEADFKAANLSVRAARMARLPYVTVAGSAQFSGRRSQSFETPPRDSNNVELPGPRISQATASETDRNLAASVALNWDVFDGLATDSRIAAARARYIRARQIRDAAQRNLESEVHQVLLTYQAAVEGDRVARRGLESAEENLKLTQQKYNVGSSTILDLIDAQVQLQRARSTQVSALAAIRVAEASIDRIRGRSQ